jgi:small subunit ribosomal protein S5
VGTSNRYNMVKATFNALSRTQSPRDVAARRGKKVGEIIGRRDTDAPAEAKEQ